MCNGDLNRSPHSCYGAQMDPLAGTPWSAPGTVEGFATSAPNPVLMSYAARVLAHSAGHIAVDIGCGAGRNAVPLAALGWRVLGIDLSAPMLAAAMRRRAATPEPGAFAAAMAPMEQLPIADHCAHLIVAHGIWNLAPGDAVFRRAIREAARIAAPNAALFVFTFSRHTLPADARALPGESFAFTQFSGTPQCFVTDTQLTDELRDAGFTHDPDVPLTEYNRPAPGLLRGTGGPVIYETAFRYTR